MANTILKNSIINEVLTTENDVDKKLLDKYSKYYEKVNTINSIAKNGVWLEFENEIVHDDFDNLENLVSFNYPYSGLKRKGKNNYAQKITKLIGYVLEIHDDYFVAKMMENDTTGTFEIGEFDLNDVDDDDKELLAIGSVFYWSVGWHIINGQVKKLSEIRFQRIAGLETDEFEDICEESDRLNDTIDWD